LHDQFRALIFKRFATVLRVLSFLSEFPAVEFHVKKNLTAQLTCSTRPQQQEGLCSPEGQQVLCTRRAPAMQCTGYFKQSEIYTYPMKSHISVMKGQKTLAQNCSYCHK